jgi:uncharacterized membrane protein YeaQ/YmgE (transglycosylase-associated protein family)
VKLFLDEGYRSVMRQPAMVLGVVGSSSRVTELNTSGVIGSVVGALILLALLGRRSSQRTLV